MSSTNLKSPMGQHKGLERSLTSSWLKSPSTVEDSEKVEISDSKKSSFFKEHTAGKISTETMNFQDGFIDEDTRFSEHAPLVMDYDIFM